MTHASPTLVRPERPCKWDNIEHPCSPERRPTGRPRDYPIREVVNAVLYICRTRLRLAAVAPRLAAVGTGVLLLLHLGAPKACGKRSTPLLYAGDARTGPPWPGVGRRPSAGVIDSRDGQDGRGQRTRAGLTRGKNRAAGKRHLPVDDTPGLIWGLVVLLADVQDRDGAGRAAGRVRSGRAAAAGGESGADGAYAAVRDWVIRESPGLGAHDGPPSAGGQGLRPPAQAVRSWNAPSAWFGRYRRLSKDYEHNPPSSSETWIYHRHDPFPPVHAVRSGGKKKGDACR